MKRIKQILNQKIEEEEEDHQRAKGCLSMMQEDDFKNFRGSYSVYGKTEYSKCLSKLKKQRKILMKANKGNCSKSKAMIAEQEMWSTMEDALGMSKLNQRRHSKYNFQEKNP